jgi:hypothetical protein
MENNPSVIPVALFRLGKVVATPHALERLSSKDILQAIQRHQAGDWGEVNGQHRKANVQALKENTRLFSVYRSARGQKFWVITEADRSATTVLMPEDY